MKTDLDSFDADDFDDDLRCFDEEFSSVESPHTEEVPDGRYQARVNTARLVESRGGNPMIRWDLIVIAGAHAGRHIFKQSVITRRALPYLKGELKTLGLELAKISDIGGRLEEVLNITLEVKKQTQGEYTNVYFNKRIQIPGDASRRDPVDDTPF